MIFETLQILKEQLDDYFAASEIDKTVLLDNISLWESGSDNASRLEDSVVITLLKIEEEPALKNLPNTLINNGKTEYRNPVVNLNLFLLISANCDTYENSLQALSKIIQFFQGKQLFTSSNTVYNRTSVSYQLFDSFKFNVTLHTPDFVELNNIWGTLGGRQLPSVIYRVQLIEIERDSVVSSGELITNVGGEFNSINK